MALVIDVVEDVGVVGLELDIYHAFTCMDLNFNTASILVAFFTSLIAMQHTFCPSKHDFSELEDDLRCSVSTMARTFYEEQPVKLHDDAVKPCKPAVQDIVCRTRPSWLVHVRVTLR